MISTFFLLKISLSLHFNSHYNHEYVCTSVRYVHQILTQGCITQLLVWRRKQNEFNNVSIYLLRYFFHNSNVCIFYFDSLERKALYKCMNEIDSLDGFRKLKLLNKLSNPSVIALESGRIEEETFQSHPEEKFLVALRGFLRKVRHILRIPNYYTLSSKS